MGARSCERALVSPFLMEIAHSDSPVGVDAAQKLGLELHVVEADLERQSLVLQHAEYTLTYRRPGPNWTRSPSPGRPAKVRSCPSDQLIGPSTALQSRRTT